MSEKSFALRRSVKPYVALIVILMGIMIFLAFVSMKLHSWEPLIATSVIWFFFAMLVFMGTRYRILLRDGDIVQEAFGKPDVVIPLNQIVNVNSQVSGVSTLIRLQRPFRRIEIRGRDKKIVDISLKHFVERDVDRLLDEVRTQRPDLAAKI